MRGGSGVLYSAWSALLFRTRRLAHEAKHHVCNDISALSRAPLKVSMEVPHPAGVEDCFVWECDIGIWQHMNCPVDRNDLVVAAAAAAAAVSSVREESKSLK